jgi:hypothetical protein
MNTYFIRKSIQSILSQSHAGKMLLKLLSLRSYFEEIGWFKSVAIGLPVDRDGNCLPWFTYPAISFLEGKVQSDMNVFEYGKGLGLINNNKWCTSIFYRSNNCFGI